MENQENSRRSRSRSRTPLPFTGEIFQKHKTADSRSATSNMDVEIIQEESETEVFTSPPAHRTRNQLKSKTPLVRQEVDSEETSLEKQRKYLSMEEVQNIKNYSYEYEHISTSQTLSTNNSRVFLDSGRDGSRIHSSLSGSDYSNESFAESVLADSSKLSVEDGIQHLPYRVYKCAIEYWNKYPKTDYTYSRLSKDRVELAPGQVAVPNMSRPSLHSVRHSTSTQDIHTASSTSSLFSESELRQRLIANSQNSYNNSRRYDSMSDSEVDEADNWRQTYRTSLKPDNRWRTTKIMSSVWTNILTIITTVTSKVFPTDYRDMRNHVGNYYTYTSLINNKSSIKDTVKKKWFWIPLLVLVLIPALLYWWFFWPLVYHEDQLSKIAPIIQYKEFELTDDMINQIVLRVKQSMPFPPTAEPAVIERIIETKTDIDHQLLAKQQELIDKLSMDIFSLKDTGDWQNDMVVSLIKDVNELKSWSATAGAFVQSTVSGDTGCHCEDVIRKIVKSALLTYDADKTGLVDYAMESAGGQVISTRCTQSYQTHTAVISLFGIPLWHPSNSPRIAITPGSSPGDCWAFQGFPGYLVIKLFHRIHVTGFSLEHVSSLLTPHGQINSAPKKFTVWGLQDESDKEPVLFGSYEYSNDSTPVQYFKVEHNAEDLTRELSGHEFIELRVESNHGNPVYTCLYRFRVHGDPIDDIYYLHNT